MKSTRIAVLAMVLSITATPASAEVRMHFTERTESNVVCPKFLSDVTSGILGWETTGTQPCHYTGGAPAYMAGALGLVWTTTIPANGDYVVSSPARHRSVVRMPATLKGMATLPGPDVLVRFQALSTSCRAEQVVPAASWSALHQFIMSDMKLRGCRAGELLKVILELRAIPKTGSPTTALDVLSFGTQVPDGSRDVVVLKGPLVGLGGLVHVQNVGDTPLTGGVWAGTRTSTTLVTLRWPAAPRRLEGFQVAFQPPIPGVNLQYMCHVQDIGDTPWFPAGTFCGTRGQSKRLEGLAIRLTGPNAGMYDLSYACSVYGMGDMGPVRNGAFCGTRGQSRTVEAINVTVTLQPPPRSAADPLGR